MNVALDEKGQMSCHLRYGVQSEVNVPHVAVDAKNASSSESPTPAPARAGNGPSADRVSSCLALLCCFTGHGDKCDRH